MTEGRPGRIVALNAGRPDDTLAWSFASAWSVRERLPVTSITVDPTARPPRRDREGRAIDDAFVETAPCIVASWRVARQVKAELEPDDLLVASDRDGLAAIAALDGWVEGRRWPLVVIASRSRLLRAVQVFGTAEPIGDDDLDDAIDLERTLYANAHVVAPSRVAADALRALGFDVHAGTWPTEASQPATGSQGGPYAAWCTTEPVSRTAATADVLRAAARCEPPPFVSEHTGAELDPLWSGTTAEALHDVLTSIRYRLPHEAADGRVLAVSGDPHAWPVDHAEADELAVPAGSVAAGHGVSAWVWGSTDDLRALQDGQGRLEAPLPVAGLPPPRASNGVPPEVTCVVPVFRDVRFLHECVASLLEQSRPPSAVLLVDDGSNLPEVDAALESLSEAHETVRTLRLPVNRGVCEARNVGLDDVTTPAVLFVDQDDVLRPDALAVMSDVLGRRPDLTGVAAWTAFAGAYEGIEAKSAFDVRSGWRHNTVVSTAVMLRVEPVRRAGIRFTPDLAWVFCEDWDLWAQVVASGGRLGLVPRPLVEHRVHRSSGGHRRRPLAELVGRTRVRARLVGGVS